MKYKIETCLYAFMLLHNFCLIYIYLRVLILFCLEARKKNRRTCLQKKKSFTPPLSWAGFPLPLGPAPRASPSLPPSTRVGRGLAAQQQRVAQQPGARALFHAEGWAPPVTVAPYLRSDRSRTRNRLRLPCHARIEDPRATHAQ